MRLPPNPKSEGRRKGEQARPQGLLNTRSRGNKANGFSDFGFRPSFGFRISAFGFLWHFIVGTSSILSASPPVTLSEDSAIFTLANGFLTARIEKRSGTLISLKYHDLELMARGQGGANGGYWSSVGRGRPGGQHEAVVRINPATNAGARAEISCQLRNEAQSPSSPVNADYRYSLGRGEHWLYVYSVLEHKPGYPPFGVGEARYCLKLNPGVFDYLSVDANRHRVMPSGYDWDHGSPLNMKEARRMTTGVHKGEPEHKYDYSAVFSETPAYGWSSTKQNVGLWMINPSLEYLGGGPTKAELTGHLDVNPGGLPTLLNMWVGSHYGGTTISVAQNEAWTKVVGPFLLYCNSAPRAADDSPSPRGEGRTALRSALDEGGGEGELRPFKNRQADWDASQEALRKDALKHAADETKLWPYQWVSDPNFPSASARSIVRGQLLLRDPLAPGLKMSNVWVGVTAPDYAPPPRFGFGFGFGRTNFAGTPSTNFPRRGFGFGRGGLPALVDWQRDAKFYQFWARADAKGRFTIPNVRPGAYTLHAIADGVLGEFTLTNITIAAAERKSLGTLTWTPVRYGRTVWEVGVPDRTAREFRHGDDYWHWGLYFDYPKEFPNDVNFVIGKSDWRRDWNYVQPPRIESRDVPMTSEDDEQPDSGAGVPPASPLGVPPGDPPSPGAAPSRSGSRNLRSTTWSVSFIMPETKHGKATLRLAFCGTHMGCDVEAFVNGKSIGETGTLPSTSAMQRDGIRAYWIEKDLPFDAGLLVRGANSIKLLSHAGSWSQGVMYDCVRLELDETKP